MLLPEIALYLSLALLSGLMIGCVGIGGVILVPLLAYGAGVPIHTVIAAAMFAYLLSGAIGTFVFARAKSIRWDMTAWMWAGAMPAAFIGALAASIAPGRFLELCIGLLTAASGLNSIFGRQPPDDTTVPPLSNVTLGGVGAFTGFSSALTGTGGPLVLVPILMWLNVPVLTSIGLSQAIQLPIAVLATGGNLYAGTLNVALGCVLAVGISFGTWAGAKLAHALPRKTLRTIVSVLLVVIGFLILGKLSYGALA